MYCCLLAREHWAYTCHGEGLAVSGKLYAFAVRGRDSRIAANDTVALTSTVAQIARNLTNASFPRFTQVQAQVLGLWSGDAAADADLICCARSGSGKTLALVMSRGVGCCMGAFGGVVHFGS